MKLNTRFDEIDKALRVLRAELISMSLSVNNEGSIIPEEDLLWLFDDVTDKVSAIEESVKAFYDEARKIEKDNKTIDSEGGEQ